MIPIDKKYSERISEFLNFVKEITDMYNGCVSMMEAEDNLTQDILHKYELANLSCKERNKLGTLLKNNRKTRRYYKDQIEEMKPIFNFAENNKQSIEALKQVLGEVRKQEKYHLDRKYNPRIMKE